MKRILALSYGIIFSLIFIGFAQACLISLEAEITYVETQPGVEVWHYDFTVANASDPGVYAGFNLFEVDFSFDDTISMASYSLPTGWDSVAGEGFANTFSIMIGIPPIGADIAPGASLSGFIFQSTAQIEKLHYQAFFTNPYGDPIVLHGTSVLVPLPSTAILLASGAIGLAWFRRRKKSNIKKITQLT